MPQRGVLVPDGIDIAIGASNAYFQSLAPPKFDDCGINSLIEQDRVSHLHGAHGLQREQFRIVRRYVDLNEG